MLVDSPRCGGGGGGGSDVEAWVWGDWRRAWDEARAQDVSGAGGGASLNGGICGSHASKIRIVSGSKQKGVGIVSASRSVCSRRSFLSRRVQPARLHYISRWRGTPGVAIATTVLFTICLRMCVYVLEDERGWGY